MLCPLLPVIGYRLQDPDQDKRLDDDRLRVTKGSWPAYQCLLVCGRPRGLTLAGWHGGIPRVIPVGCLLARGRALADQAVAAVAGPAHQTVELAARLADDRTVLWRVWGAAVQSCTERGHQCVSTSWLPQQCRHPVMQVQLRERGIAGLKLYYYCCYLQAAFP